MTNPFNHYIIQLIPREKRTLANHNLHSFRRPVEQVTVTAPITRDGVVTFFRLHHGWTCGECSARVPIPNFRKHVTKCHGRY